MSSEKPTSSANSSAPRPVGRGGGAMRGIAMSGAKAKDFKGTLKMLLSYISVYKWGLIAVIFFAVIGTAFSIFGPKILGNATTEIFNGVMSKVNGGSGINFAALGNILLFLLGLYIVSSVFTLIQGFIMTGISQKVTYNLREQLSKKIAKIPMGYFDSVTHGEVLSRITNDVDTLSQSLNQTLTQLITSFCTLIGIAAMMITISWQMTLFAILILPLSLGIIRPIIKRSQKYFKMQQELLGTINGQVEEIFSGQHIVKVFNREKTVTAEFSEKNDKLYGSAWRAQFLSGLMMPIMTFIGNIGYVGVSVLGGYLAIRGTITIGDIQSFIQYTKSFTQPITQVAQVSNMLQSMMAAAERVFEFLAEDEEIQTVDNPVPVKNIQGDISFEHVHFGYTSEKIIINDFSAHIKKGQKIAIVGPTGAGKTTMVKLLMRFYDITEGKIILDSHDIRNYDRGEYRTAFAMVLQDTWLFSGSIMENIRYGRLEASDDEVINAAKAAHIHHFIQTLPNGYHMVLNEEASNVSQGQKQLLTIARAILANPKMLILDEATSSVDTRTETRIQKAMDALMKNRTSFIIAHRLSTIRDANLILVMKDGDIIEQGTHDELIAANGFYTDLYNSQFQAT